MGTTCAFILAHSSPDELPWSDEAEWEGTYVSQDSDWAVLQVPEAAYWEREDVLAKIVQQTAAGALIALTLDGDFLAVQGLGSDGAQWSGVVDREAAIDYRAEGEEEGYEDIVPEFPTPERSAANAVVWARGNGLRPDEKTIGSIFSVEVWEQPRDQYWWDLLAALGLRPRSAD